MTEAIAQSRRYTYRDYCQWSEDKRWELIEGVPYAMSPAPGLAHQTVVGDLFLQVGEFLREKSCRAFFAPFNVRLPDRDEADKDIASVVQPDILVVCDESKLDERGCRGAPDWIIYRLERDGRYGRPEIAETKGARAVGLFKGLEIDWDQVFSHLNGLIK